MKSVFIIFISMFLGINSSTNTNVYKQTKVYQTQHTELYNKGQYRDYTVISQKQTARLTTTDHYYKHRDILSAEFKWSNNSGCESCSAGAICNSSIGKCQCREGLKSIDGQCKGSSINQSCENQFSCGFVTQGSICIRGICQCSVIFPIHTHNKCVKCKSIDEFCLDTTQCQALTDNSICDKFSVCACPYKYKLFTLDNRKACLRVYELGDTCKSDNDCKRFDKNSICLKPLSLTTKGICDCKDGYEGSYGVCSANETTISWFIRIAIGLGAALVAAIIALIIAAISRKLFYSLRLARQQQGREMIQRQHYDTVSDNLPKYEDVVTTNVAGLPSYSEALQSLCGSDNVAYNPEEQMQKLSK